MSRALISVSDKTGLIPMAQALVAQGIEIISTGGTKRFLDEAGLPTKAVEEVTGFPEMMDGRVKTLHPKIHGGLLALRDNKDHQTAMKNNAIEYIDFVIVNLYPFKQTIQNQETSLAEAIEQIDIGGPSMIRSAAKNYQSVTVVVDPRDYPLVIQELEDNGKTAYATRQQLAQKVFAHTASYDTLIADYLASQIKDVDENRQVAPVETLTLTYERMYDLRYGENAHQTAAVYQNPFSSSFAITKAKILNGKPLSYNNLRDADAAIKMVRDFPNQACAVAVKHMNPCGIAVAETIELAFERCRQADPISIFGGIVVINRNLTVDLAQTLHSMFLDVIIAPDFEPGALDILKQKANVRVLQLKMDDLAMDTLEITSVTGGLLVQEADILKENPDQWQQMGEVSISKEQRKALAFAWNVVKHVKSNAIVISNDHQTYGIGAGQTNRVGAAKIALEHAKELGADFSEMVLASDAFIPMIDTIELANQYHIKAIVQPGGSIGDKEVIAKADEYGITMLATNVRHFRH
ncbi:bifunctional phosphoribosylaminoimidazolecarboxamide formyltransferase/IMP cyclohydrolase [Facklamia miroungae]|uniref:Bifunctional purine biosynthesis protein PurH n=1 Tax=Facklamia miroungae TaxID=120956 RepID=A0A1G7P5W1_9LACT|nr:bifunctional phosphoribosylaminoimidazolecarboxamide formyltransferase/IMP cyclohydrolase [Facklamia miroungae]NKZ28591.1 bifunctional phosphoribosylaminoimidazolecarboxamide formyltransferase/IMP cyclohydrolase [Facklamia miroungae]SDF81624.1 phosphoribosylaminoimidazolecarboxamide formyltransferase / IMP cyclohydrolase [Facklamia miroungae]